jgi:hypothetical protein
MKKTIAIRFYTKLKVRRIFHYSAVLLAFIFVSGYSFGQNADSTLKSFRLFEDEELLNITLKFDLSTYFRSKPQKEYLKANITIYHGTSDSVSRDIRLKTRGVFRNSYCLFAPIELNLKKANFGYSDLNKISRLKLVPQCSSGKDKEDYVLREYLVYKLFNVMTDTSFRVRLVRVSYIDSQKDRKPVKQYAFLLEPVEMLAARTNCMQVKTVTINQKSIEPWIMDRIAIFNFMIGNYDWSVPGQHNIQVLKTLNIDPFALGVAVPHDFDWTGLVNPTYAVPAENVGTENVRERIFLGVCRNRNIYNKELDIFLSKKDDFYEVINEFQYITQKVKKDMTDYLDGFFRQLEGRRDMIMSTLLNSCKNF